MPWLLLRKPRDPAKSAHPSPGRRHGASDGREAWVVVGCLERALCQAGMLETLLANGRRPALVYAGGIATVNAIFAARGRSSDVRLGWERLRAARFLPAAALDARGAPRLLGNHRADALAALRALFRSAPTGDGNTDLVLLTAAGFANASRNGETTALDDLLSADMLRADATPTTLATAIDDACARNATRVVVCAVESALGADIDLGTAIDCARGSGIDVLFLSASGHTRPGLLHYLLPGLGGPERLAASGRAAAEHFLDELRTSLDATIDRE